MIYDWQHQGLRAWAKGGYPYEAAVELLIRTGMAERMGGYLLDHDMDPEVRQGFVYPDVAAFLASGPGLSGGERRLFAVIANLLDEQVKDDPLHLADLAGLDRRNVALVLAAVSHACGTHESGGALYPWGVAGAMQP